MRSAARAIVVVAFGAAAAFAVARALARRRAARVSSLGDVVPPAAEDQAELVDAAIDDSFPASDPPSYWGRDADRSSP